MRLSRTMKVAEDGGPTLGRAAKMLGVHVDGPHADVAPDAAGLVHPGKGMSVAAAGSEATGLHGYLEIERQLLDHRAKRWLSGLPEDEDAEARFFEQLEDAAAALTPEERTALREIVIERATIRPGDADVDVASPRRTGHGPRRVARIA